MSIYQYIMPKVKLTISIDEEIAKDLRARSIDKYGNSRSLSQLIEDLATGSAEAAPVMCNIGLMSKGAIAKKEKFDADVKIIDQQLEALKFPDHDYGTDGMTWNSCGPHQFFVLKDALELRLNDKARKINVCPDCMSLDGPLPLYPDAGRNYEQLYLLSSEHR